VIKYYIITVFIFVIFLSNFSHAAPPKDEQSGVVIGSLIAVAINYDLYCLHCLGLSLPRYLNGVDNLLLKKYGVDSRYFIDDFRKQTGRDMFEENRHLFRNMIKNSDGCESSEIMDFEKKLETIYFQQLKEFNALK